MATLDSWLNQAVRRLSKDSTEIVRREIQEHYDAARDAALSRGIDPQQADAMALQALGDPRLANRQYRKVLLTKSEAAVLRNSVSESRMICSSGWTKWVLLSTPGTLLVISAIAFAGHMNSLGRGVLIMAALMAMFFLVPLFPIYTPARGRIFRVIKWLIFLGSIIALFGPASRDWTWLTSCCFYPMFYTEWKRMMIRRKLPIAQWPKQLYL
jgi:hypothetical protein